MRPFLDSLNMFMREYPMHFLRKSFFFVCSLLLILELYSPVLARDTIVENVQEPILEREDSFSFIVWGHPRGPRWSDPPTHAKEIVDRLKELKPDLLIVTGDAIEGMLRQQPNPDSINTAWDLFDHVVQQAGIPVHIAPGNHDVNNPVTRDIFLERYPKTPYAFTHKGTRFVILDTVGLDPQSQGETKYFPGWEGVSWYAGAIPFDENQLNFIRNEISKQNQFNHMFFFMHHTLPWAESDGFWSQEIHPLLPHGKTRAVFSGNPAFGKYAYLKKDGITYIQHAVYEALPPDWFVWRRDRAPTPQYKQFDNLQLVTIQGSEVTYRPIILGWLNAEGLSIKYWKDVDSKFQWNHRLEQRFHQTFYKLPHLLLLMAGLVIFGLISGFLAHKIWRGHH